MWSSLEVVRERIPELPASAELENLIPMVGSPNPALGNSVDDPIRHLSILVRVAEVVTRSLSLDHQLPQLIELIAKALDAERASLFLHDSSSGELFSRVIRGEGVAEIRIPQSTGIVGAVFSSGRVEVIENAYRDPRFNPEVDRRTGYRTRNILCAPLRNATGQVIGVTEVLNKRSDAFGEIDVALLEAINRHAASALEQAHMVERLEQARRDELEVLAITEAISSELHLDVLLGRIVGRLRSCSTPSVRRSSF